MLIKNKRIKILTLGCRANLFESSAIEQELIHNQAIIEKDLEKAQIGIINTCSVTNKADIKSKYFINKFTKKQNIKLVIVIGCYSQINKINNKKIKIILGTKYKNQLVNILKSFHGKKIIKIEPTNTNTSFETFCCDNTNNITRALLKIQDGCNYSCKYCLIPKVRGPQKSMNSKDVLNKIIMLSKTHKEIVLTGINLASYINGRINFLDLLNKINQLKIDARIRISSVEPFQINRETIDLITSNPNRWCQALHICIQNADDNVLQSMGRQYSVQQFIDLCDYIRLKNPLFSITTDYIVGFPTETDENFQNELINIDRVSFSNMHVFPFSSRKKTQANKLISVVTNKQLCERLKIINDKNLINKIKYLNKFLNKEVTVVFENGSWEGYQYGHSEYFFLVYVKSNKDLHRTKQKIKITHLINDRLFGFIN